ncbi:BgMsFReDn2 [Biomphalaria glabrata]
MSTVASFSCDQNARLESAIVNFMSAVAAVNKRIDDECIKKNSAQDSCRNVTSVDPRPVVVLAYGLKVMCDTKTDGGGWTIIQRRINGKVDFQRSFNEYRDGFGDFTSGEFYLGNENIYRLTTSRQYELRIDLEYKNVKYYARYSSFKLAGEKDNYRLNIQGYSGNMTDHMLYHQNKPFTAYDRDNDDCTVNCAVEFTGGWWFSNCHEANLNGLWGSVAYGKGIKWATLTGDNSSANFVEMKIREK